MTSQGHSTPPRTVTSGLAVISVDALMRPLPFARWSPWPCQPRSRRRSPPAVTVTTAGSERHRGARPTAGLDRRLEDRLRGPQHARQRVRLRRPPARTAGEMLIALPDQTLSAGLRAQAGCDHPRGAPPDHRALQAYSCLWARRQQDHRFTPRGGRVSDALLDTVGRSGDRPRSAGRGRRDDTRAGSVSAVTGPAVSGPLEGRRLRPMTHDAQLWFAVAAFLPDVEIVLPS